MKVFEEYNNNLRKNMDMVYLTDIKIQKNAMNFLKSYL